MFKWKPDGEVTFMYAQDNDGKPAPVMQDPLHYPFGTHFMAPGQFLYKLINTHDIY